MLELNKLYQGDTLELVKQIKNESVDLIVTDPPYPTTKKRYKQEYYHWWNDGK